MGGREEDDDDGEELMRSRLVARDFRPRRGGPNRPDLFAAMPPLEAKKMLFIMTVAGGAFEKRGTKDEQQLMFIDVCKAHLNGVVDDQQWVFVELPPEFHANGRFVRIRRWSKSMRKAAISWEKNNAEKLAAVRFKGSRAAPTTFYNPATKVGLVVHGDDFTFSEWHAGGAREDAWLVQEVVRCEGQRYHGGEWHGRRHRGGDLTNNPQVHGDGPRENRGRQAQGLDSGGVGAGARVLVVGVPGVGSGQDG